MKRFYAFALILCLSLVAFAEKSGSCGPTLSWILADNGTLTINGSGEMNDYEDEESTPWYTSRMAIKVVQMENKVTYIGIGAFRGCENLKLIAIPASVMRVGDAAFEGCTSLPVEDEVRYAGTCAVEAMESTAETYNLKAGTRFIGGSAFAYRTNLKTLNVPSSVVAIGASAFNGCSSLSTITLAHGLQHIGEAAFEGCSSLSSFTIPSSVTNMEEGVFEGCYFKKEKFDNRSGVSSLNQWHAVFVDVETEDGLLIKDNEVKKCRAFATAVTIPEGVKSIAEEAFGGCEQLTSVALPSTVTSIGDYAFWNCVSLTTAEIPSTCTSVGEGIFDGTPLAPSE